MSGVYSDKQSALKYGIDVDAIEEATGRTVTANMQRRCNQLVGQYTSDQRREPAITNALTRKTLQWTRP